MAKTKIPPLGAPPTTTQQAVATAVREAESVEGSEAPAEPTQQLILSLADRKKLLGRLAEFELMLLKLTPNQANFVMAYVADPTDGARAARTAGYSERRAAATACDLLSRPGICAVIALGEQLREDRTMITSDRTLHEIAILAHSDITHFEFSRGQITTKAGVPTYMTRAISAVEFTETEFIDDKGHPRTMYKTKIRLWSKETALRMLAVYQKLLSSDAIQPGGTTIVNDNRGQFHQHNHMHQTWKIGTRELTF